MSCPYYWYNNHYACRKTEKDVNEDIYITSIAGTMIMVIAPFIKGRIHRAAF